MLNIKEFIGQNIEVVKPILKSQLIRIFDEKNTVGTMDIRRDRLNLVVENKIIKDVYYG